MGKMKNALVRLAKKVTGKEVEDTNSISNVVNFMADNYEGGAFEDIVDKNGNARFVEGNGTPLSFSGFNSTFCKWSLSGSHLMFVLVGNFSTGTQYPSDALASFTLPTWILNKIYTIVGNEIVETKSINFYSTSESVSFTKKVDMKKENNTIKFYLESGQATTNYYFRIQFDLLIDNE